MARKYDYLTKEIAYPIIARYYKNGGGLPSTFYNKEGLSECQFYTWRKRYVKDHPEALTPSAPFLRSVNLPKPSAPTNFHPIQVSAPVSASEKSDLTSRIELEYPNGVILRVDGILNDSRLASLIKLY